MRRLFYLLVIFTFYTFVSLNAQAFQPDWQSWTSVGLKKNFKKGFALDAQYQIRFDHDISTFKASYISAGLSYKVNKYLEFGLGYRFATNYNDDQHRFSGVVTLSYGKKKWDFDLRISYQNDIASFNKHYLDYHPSSQFLRTRLTISKTIKKHWKLYTSCELFIYLSNTKIEFQRIRNIVGFKYDFKKYHSMEVGFLFQPEVNASHPDWLNAISIGYEFSIPKWKKFKGKKK